MGVRHSFGVHGSKELFELLRPFLAEPERVYGLLPRHFHDRSDARGNAGRDAAARSKTGSYSESRQSPGGLREITLRARRYARRYRCRPQHRSRHARNFESGEIAGNDFSASRMDIFGRSSAADRRRSTLLVAPLLGTPSRRAVSNGDRQAQSDPALAHDPGRRCGYFPARRLARPSLSLRIKSYRARRAADHDRAGPLPEHGKTAGEEHENGRR